MGILVICQRVWFKFKIALFRTNDNN